MNKGLLHIPVHHKLCISVARLPSHTSGLRSLLCIFSIRQIVFLCLILATITACDRPFVPPRAPNITVISPTDPTALQLDPEVEIRVEASSFRDISHLEIEGKPMTFDASNGSWYTSVTLSPGINDLTITAYDVEDFPGTYTLVLAHLNPRFVTDAPTFPDPWRLGGHTATLLNDGSVLVTGGAPSMLQEAVNQAFILPPNADALVALTAQLNNARYGHSANLLPDGRVLILGGSTTAATRDVSKLVTTAEIYDPVSETFTLVDFTDASLAIMEHVAFVTMGPSSLIVDVYGGLGQDPFSTSGLPTVRGDVRTFRFVNNTLTTLSSFSDSQLKPAFGMAATQLNEGSGTEMERFLVTGNNFMETGAPGINFSIDFNAAPIRVDLLDELTTKRIQHASAALEPGLVFIFGGFQGTLLSISNSTEIFVEFNDRFSNIDSRVSTIKRFSHTATKLPSNRILVLGGFSESGEAIRESVYFQWGL